MFLTTGIIYSVLGIVVSTAIEDIPPLATLAWDGYGGGTWWGYLIMYVVMIFPAADAISSFPLNGIVLGENLLSLYYSNLSIKELEALPLSTLAKFRLSVVIPPIMIAFFAFSLGLAQDWSGLLAYYVVYLNIGLLHLYT